MFRSYVSAYGKSYGYGWVVGNDAIGSSNDSVLVIEHGGTISGFSALISRIPSERHLIVLLNNTRPTPFASIVRGIRGILYDKPYDLPKRSIAETVFSWIQEKGISFALEQYRELQSRHDTTYALDQDQMIQVGYRLLRSGKAVEAVETFKLNVEAFPKSSKVYESLGDGYLVHGDKELAIRNYLKCLELDPTRSYAAETLKQLLAK
jgi:tetratricopeptide (TPR) repeat protein